MKIEHSLHHCVPRSMDGTNGENLNGGNSSTVPAALFEKLSTTDVKNCNITLLPDEEHADFHRILGRKVPDAILRMLLLRGIHARDQQYLPPGAAKDLLFLLINEDWREPYYPEAFRSVKEAAVVDERQRIMGRYRLAQTALHLRRDIEEERNATHNAIEFVVQGRFLPREAVQYAQDAREFLSGSAQRVMSLRDCMRRYLSDCTHPRGELKWVKSMRPSFRSALLDILASAGPVNVRDHALRRQYVNVLIDHQTALDCLPRAWKPNIHEYREEIENLAMHVPSQLNGGEFFAGESA